MRHVPRSQLDPTDAEELSTRQRRVDELRRNDSLNVGAEWKAARATRLLDRVLGSLRRMVGEHSRCMYCLDSSGTDIEHWRPKTPFPEFMFQWHNLLLCCAECGRYKGNRFPVAADGRPLMLDPTVDDPWQHLDFDPLTGLLTARFDPESGCFDARGRKTAELLCFAGRDGMQAGYRRTWRRLAAIVLTAMQRAELEPDRLLAELAAADDHGLLPWCFSPRGGKEPPFRDLLARHPETFAACATHLQHR
jgi:uncharacterized protein (TIGR02646 family)